MDVRSLLRLLFSFVEERLTRMPSVGDNQSPAAAATLPSLQPPKESLWNRFKDALVLPGLLQFTKCGFLTHRGKSLPCNSLSNKTVLITGGTSGIGLAAVRELVRIGASVILVARDVAKAERVRSEILEVLNPMKDVSAAPDGATIGSIVIEQADMALMADVYRLAKRLPSLDVVINNCGLLVPKGEKRQQTSEGVELTLATNLLSHFILTNIVQFNASDTFASRVVNVSSGGMYSTKIFPTDLEYADEKNAKGFDGVDAYARTKRAQVVLTEMWGEILGAKYHNAVVCHCMHPGWVDTPGVQYSLPDFYKTTTRFGMLRTPDQGADTIVWLAATDDESVVRTTGGFWLDRQPHVKHMSSSTKETAAERIQLWNSLSEHAERILAQHHAVSEQELPLFRRMEGGAA